jgi:Head fiber protein.
MIRNKIEDFQIHSQKLETLIKNVGNIKQSVQNIEDLPTTASDNDIIFIKSKKKYYVYEQSIGQWKPMSSGDAETLNGKNSDDFAEVDHIHDLASHTKDGFLSKEDKIKLDGITGTGDYVLPVATSTVLGGVKKGANVTISQDGTISVAPPYVHPDTHPASMIIETTSRRFVTDAEKEYWNNKANASDVYTKSETEDIINDIIGSAPDALNTLQELALALNNDANFASNIALMLSNKVDKENGKGLSTNDFTNEEKNKLDSIEENANYYVHPNTHSADMIVETPNRRFVTDAEKEYWNNKLNSHDFADYYTKTEIENMINNKVNVIPGKGLSTNDYTDADKYKLSNIENNANYYVHPANHPASIIIQDSNNRFVTDNEKDYWNAKMDADSTYTSNEINLLLANKVDKENGKVLSTNDYTNDDKYKLANIEENANHYIHPANHPADIIVETSMKRFVTDVEKEYWNNKANAVDVYTKSEISSLLNPLELKTTVEPSTNNGYIKIDGVQTLVYKHPQYHSADEISETDSKTFVSKTERNYWNGKVNFSDIFTRSEIINILNVKVDKIEGKGLSTNDFTNELKNKLQILEKIHIGTSSPTDDSRIWIDTSV